ncbi:phospholipase [Alginatibacterium sediminis]|uniref:phospholipase D n=1 Tax=Alginatibacterium sediminis TaxID=2164068 RepID=A0A420EH02_9ALTE|nr:phospholipase D-like domain-containing protein [Alginatibacterium sediminis]RKF20001.1 phospholipase [Alginatibacterium sediminis]
MAIKHGDIEFYAGPQRAGALDNLEKVIVDFINLAHKSLDIAVQELENRNIAQAVIEAKRRKVRVRLVIEQHYLRSSVQSKTPWSVPNRSSNEENRLIHDALLRANIDIKSDYNPHIFHQKFIVRDSQSVLTGSTNFTLTGTDKNLNHIVIVHDSVIAKIYRKEFSEIQKGRFGSNMLSHDPIPKRRLVSDISIKVLFAPEHSPEMEIMKQMLKAKKRIDFAIFTFSKSSGIDDTMYALLNLGISINGVFDAAAGAQKWAPLKRLEQQGAHLYAAGHHKGIGKLHHKLMVIDDSVVIAGSFNYTGPANRLNDENIIVLGDLETKNPLQQRAQGALAKYVRCEIDRIKAENSR